MDNYPVDQYPLSPVQQGMLFHYMSAPGAGTDIEQIVCTLCEEVDPAQLHYAWERVVDRHDVLRTSFHFDENGGIVQRVMSRVNIPWCECDWRQISKEEQAARLEELVRTDRHSVFNVSVAPLVRLNLIRTGEAEYCLLWTFHHALLD